MGNCATIQVGNTNTGPVSESCGEGGGTNVSVGGGEEEEAAQEEGLAEQCRCSDSSGGGAVARGRSSGGVR